MQADFGWIQIYQLEILLEVSCPFSPLACVTVKDKTYRRFLIKSLNKTGFFCLIYLFPSGLMAIGQVATGRSVNLGLDSSTTCDILSDGKNN